MSLMRDRDQIYGEPFRDRLAGMGIEEVLSAPRSPWQNPFVERLSARSAASVSITWSSSASSISGESSHPTLFYYHHSRTHLSLDKDPPHSRTIMSPEAGDVVELPEVGGLHHRYERRAA